MWRTISPLVNGTLSIAAVLSLWWSITALGLVSPFILPAPGDVLEGFRDIGAGYLGGTLLDQLVASLSVVLTGYVLAALIGVPLGVAMAWFPAVNVLFAPVLSVMRPVPPPAWIPLAILWFGIGLSGKTFIVTVAAIVPCLLNSYAGIRETPANLLDAARTLGASRNVLLFGVAIPSASPMILTGLRIALGNAWATVVAAELVVATAGFGYVIMSGYRNLEPRFIAVGMLAVGVIGTLLNVLFRRLERRLLRWDQTYG